MARDWVDVYEREVSVGVLAQFGGGVLRIDCEAAEEWRAVGYNSTKEDMFVIADGFVANHTDYGGPHNPPIAPDKSYGATEGSYICLQLKPREGCSVADVETADVRVPITTKDYTGREMRYTGLNDSAEYGTPTVNPRDSEGRPDMRVAVELPEIDESDVGPTDELEEWWQEQKRK